MIRGLRSWQLALLVAVLGTVVFMPAVTGGWIYDDRPLIEGNPYIHSFHDWPRWFMTDFWDFGVEYTRQTGRIAYWRPTVTTTYAIDWAIGNGSPLVFHITNYVWQALVAGLAFVTLRRWLGGPTWAAVAAALLFAVHPTKAESVAWIAGRTDVICMVALLVAAQGVAMRLRGQRGGVIVEFAGTLLAYTSKEQAIVLPMFVMVEAWVAGGRKPIDWRLTLTLIRAAGVQIAIAVAYMVVRKLVMPIEAINLEGGKLPFGEHASMILETLGRFAELAVIPHDLSIQHGLAHFVGQERVTSTPHIVVGAAMVIALVAIAYACRRRIPAVTAGIVFFGVTLAPTSNIINTQMMTLVSERFLYMPLLGLAFAVGAVLVHFNRRGLYVAAAVAIALLAVQAVRRSNDFSNEDQFWERELALHPGSAEARFGRISALIRDRRYRAALAETLELTRKASQNQLPAVTHLVKLLAALTPDRDRATLETIDAFTKDVIASKAPAAELTLPNLTYRVPTGTSRFARYVAADELTLIGLRASLRSRLGDDEGALALAQQALTSCPTCPSAAGTAALALASASMYAEAESVLSRAESGTADTGLQPVRSAIEKSRAEFDTAAAETGPAQLRAQAAAFAALDLWGRAYDVLAPHKDAIRKAPKFVLGFAELAMRAGDVATAREVLADTMPPAEIDAAIADWSAKMGWAD